MDLEHLYEDLLKITKKIKELQAEKEILLSEIADVIIPYNIGDIVASKGYTYRDRKCKITHKEVYLSSQDKVSWRVFANLFNKKGILSSRTTQCGRYEEENPPTTKEEIFKLQNGILKLD